MSNSGLNTWLSEDVEFFPPAFLGLRRPDGGFFLAVEGQSTDDGKVFINALQDQDEISFVAGRVKSYELDNIVAQAKISLRSKAFRDFASDDETEHGVAVWKLDDEFSFVAIFGTQRSGQFVDKGLEWLGETNLTYQEMKKGCGLIDASDVSSDLTAAPASKSSFKV